MDADRVLVPEGLAKRIDRHEADLRGVERVDAHVRRAAGMGRPADVARELADAPVVRQRHDARPSSARGVVWIIIARSTSSKWPSRISSGLPPRSSSVPAARWLTRHSRSPPSSAGTAKNTTRPARCAITPVVVQAPSPRPASPPPAHCGRTRARRRWRDRPSGWPATDQRVELADERERRPRALAARHLRPHAREREPRPRRQPEPRERLLDQLRGLHLLESQLRTPPDPLPDPDDVGGPPIHRLEQPPLQLVLCHPVHHSL